MRTQFFLVVLLVAGVSFLEASAERFFHYGEPLIKDLGMDAAREGGHIWKVVWDEQGVAYLGRDTLWRWDGTSMKQLGPDHLVELKGMCFDPQGRLWLGSFNEIGVFDPVSQGYSSRLDWIPREKQAFGQVWNIHHDGEFLWVATDHQLFRVGEGSFRDWDFPGDHRVIFHFLASGVYAHQDGVGLWRLEDGEMQLLSNDPGLAERSVLFLEDQPDGSLLAVSGSGVYFFDESNSVINSTQNSVLSGLLVSAICRLDERNLIIGTLGQGCYFYNLASNTATLIDTGANTEGSLILNVSVDPNNYLWIAVEGNLKRLVYHDSARVIKSSSHFSLGFINSIEISALGLAAANDKGFLFFPSGSNKSGFRTFSSIGESKKTLIHEGKVYFDDYDSLMVLEGGEARELQAFDREIRSFALAGPERLFVAFNDRLAAYRMGPGGELELLGEHRTLNGLIELEADADGRVWGWSHRTPVLEAIVSEGQELVVRRHDTIAGRDLFSEEHHFGMTKAGPVLVFKDRVARHDKASGTWETAPFGPGLGRLQALDFRMEANGLAGWLVMQDSGTGSSLLVEVSWPSEGALEWRILPWPGMEEIGPVMELAYVDEEEPFFVIGGMQGLFIAPVSLSDSIPPPDQPVIWEGFDGIEPALDREMDFGAGNLRYSYSAPQASWHYPVRYQTRIEGMDTDWTPPSAFAFRDTGQLLDGSFRFEVRAVDPFGRTGPVASLRLTVNPPWRRTGWAYLVYAIGTLLVGACVLLYFVHRERIKQRNLARLVEERTHELKQANAFKDLLIANLSHEIRNPLNGVIGLIRQLKENAPPPSSHLKSLRQAADYLRNTVEGVLDFSKIQSGQLEVNLKPVNLRPVLMGPVGIYRSQAVEKGLELPVVFEVADELVVVTDEQKVQQIMGNLVSNAIKFTERGTVSIAVRLEAGESGQGTLEIVVRDTGPGIAPEEQEKIFNEFYQGKGPGLKPPGTGLGLALVRQYVDCLQGQIDLDTAPGKGSCFSVTLPVHVAAFGSAVEAAAIPAPPLDFSVLVVEDTDYNRLFMEDFLVERGCRVDLAEDGDTGLRMAREGDYDIIFLDWELPGLDGLEITRALRADPAFDQSTLLVGLTAFATEDRRTAGLEAGMSAFMVKPLGLSELYGVLEAHFPEFAAKVEAWQEAGEPDPGPGEVAEALISGRGLLAEMSASKDWEDLKERWLGIFNEHVLEVAAAMENGDTGEIRRFAHKLLGHLRMIRAEPVADPVQKMLVAAHAGDMESIRRHWSRFNGLLEAFRQAYRQL
ncbi:MAG: ATP-binding protein [Puniceicoccaceae bacterium]